MSVVVSISALKRRSSSLFWVLGSYAAIICRRRLAPRRPLARSRSSVVALRSNSPSRSARSMATASSCGLMTALRSRRVRARVVTGMPSCTVKSCGSRHAGPVDPHARWAMPPGDHDHLHVRCIRAEPPQVRRRAVAKPGAGPAGHHGREIPTARRHLRHPDGIDAAVDAMQQALPDSPRGPSTGRAPGPVAAALRSPRAVERPARDLLTAPQVRNPIAIRHSDYSPGQGGTGGVTRG